MCEKTVIAYIYSEELESQCNRLPTMRKRASLVHDLIQSYKLLDENIKTVQNIEATDDELKLFHSSAYLEFMKRTNDVCEDDFETFDTEQEDFGLGYDCPMLERNYDFMRIVGGSSLTAAKLLTKNEYKYAINWFGGWHHAQRDSAEGFCYVNDVVIAIQKLTERFSRILYLDLDVHHGNGVQNAFGLSRKVLTMSLHKSTPGFYPGTGSVEDVGVLGGENYSINMPYGEGISHKSFLCLFQSVFPRVMEVYEPQVIVVQCGADALNGDPLGQCNLILESIGQCVRDVLRYDLPTMFLGGGGYNGANTARLWTYLTALILDRKLHEDIPDTSKYFTKYGPSYELKIDAGNQKDCNSEEYLKTVIASVLVQCSKINCE